MIRRVYDIHGFDCANCAEKSEAHLAKADGITSARIDFVSEKLYLTYTREEFPIDKIKAIIKEVESDPVEITLEGEERVKKFDFETFFLLLRIAYCVAVFFICGFAFKDLYWVRFSLYLSALVFIEYDIFYKVVRNIVGLKNPLDEYLLIFLASTGAFVLASLKYKEEGQAVAFGNEVFMMEEHFEAVLVCLLWQVGELLQSLAVKASRKAIEKAVGSRVEEALLLTQEGSQKVASKSLREGDIVIVNSGNLIPVDGEVIEGEGYCDTSSLTGESLPVVLKEGEKTYGGTLLISGEVKVKASKDYASSASMKVLDLVTSSMEKKGEAEKFITKFARIYTPVIFLVAIAYILIAGLLGPSWRSAVYTGLEIMVISCPCAIVISVPLAYFASIGAASKKGIVIKGASYLDELHRVNEVCLDKTGTLTKGMFVLKEKQVDSAIKESEFNAILRSLESRSSHPLSKAICLGLPDASSLEVAQFASVLGYGVKGQISGKTYYAGNAKYLETFRLHGTQEKDGVYVYLFDEKKVYGYVRLKDETKNEAHEFIHRLHQQGIAATLLSGDKEENVAAFAAETGLVSYRADLLPEDKLSVLEEKKAEGKTVAFIGDGVNDAPCLKRADVGVAMGGLGADMAIEESDVALMQDNPLHFLSAISIARHCRATVIFNIAFALFVKVAVLVLAMVFKEKMPMEIAVLSDTGLSVLLVFNSLLLLSRRN